MRPHSSAGMMKPSSPLPTSAMRQASVHGGWAQFDSDTDSDEDVDAELVPGRHRLAEQGPGSGIIRAGLVSRPRIHHHVMH